MPITHDVDRGVAEIERLAGTPGIRGIMIPTMWHDRKAYNDPAYEPIWAAAAANGLVVHVHSGEAPREEYGDDIGPYLAEVAWWSARPISFLLFGGVFERHPDLKFCVTEGAAYWASDMMWKWDQYFGGGHTTAKLAHLMKGKISKLPSEYFGTNIFIGASTMSREEIRRRYVIGCDVMMWGTDYPHPEGTWPDTVGVLKRSFHDVPVDDTEQARRPHRRRVLRHGRARAARDRRPHRADARGPRPGPVVAQPIPTRSRTRGGGKRSTASA